MKKVLGVVLAVVLLLPLTSTAVLAHTVVEDPRDIEDATRVYKFNIIGVKNPKDATLLNDNGKRIFVNLDEPSKINLIEGPDFDILDANGTDKDGALIQMPLPGLDPYNVTNPGNNPAVVDTMSDYSIYIRSLGKPGGAASITTCAELLDSEFGGLLSGKFVRTLNREGAFGGEASIEQVTQSVTERPKGKSNWYNVTAELTTIVFLVKVDISEEGGLPEYIYEYIRVPIFDDIIGGEYWEYDNNGLKNLHVWIYDNSTDVSEGDEDLPPLPPL